MRFFSEFLIGVRLAMRARYLGLSLGLCVVLTVAVLLAAQFSGRQPATVGLDVGFSVLRLLLPLVLVLLVQELLSREFERRYSLNTLAYPRPRYYLLLGRFLAAFVMVLVLLGGGALLLALLAWLLGLGYVQSTPVELGGLYFIAISFMGVELFLLAAFACLLAVFASTPSFVLIGAFGFILVSRSFAAVVELLSRDFSIVAGGEQYQVGLGLLGYIFPDLGALDVRMIALYGMPDFLPVDWPWLLFSSLAYSAFLLALAVWVLQCKRFA